MSTALNQQYDLDKDVKEVFRFTLKGHLYEFRQMTTEEIDKFQTLKEEKEVREYLYTFVTPVNEKDPPFAEITKQMLAPHWKNFIAMVKTEMTGEDGNN